MSPGNQFTANEGDEGMAELQLTEFLVLNALYLRKIADAATVVETSGVASGDVADVIEASDSDGRVHAIGSQYVLTTDGRAAVLEYYEEAYRSLREVPAVLEWYEKFEAANERFLQLVSAWQVEGAAEATGQSRAYDRLMRVVEKHTASLDEAAEWLPRYGYYADRFRRSLSQVDAGRMEYVTSPTVDSLHNIWFEFHEDILALLGRPRETVDG